jgi:NAD(P)-dependent dehydrogenase (short-subunit alcohol dehydrogenase family)
MWTLSAPTPDQLTADALDAAGARLCGSVAALVAAIESLRLTTPPRVWLVSRGAQPVGGERAALAIAQSPLWGLGRSLAMEHSDLWGGLVDLDPDVPAAEAMVALAAEMLAPDGEDQIAFRGGERHAARLTRRSCPEPQAGVTCRADATYIVTGGLGGLGLLVARWLVERGARHLALLGRSGLGPHDRRHAVIEGMRDVGATVRVVPADVGDATSVTTLLDGLRADGWPAVRGVVHAAGIMRYRPLVDTTAADVTDVLRAKVRGAWLLHAALTGTPLDFFVLFSSASAVLSSGMIALYAAGNAFLDALAHHRVARGLPAVSIDWGLWTGAGMAEAADATAVGTMAARGMGSIEPERGLHALARVLAAAPIQIAVLPTDWARLRDHYPAFSAAPLLERLNAERVAPPATVSTAAAEVRTASPEERRRRLPAFVAGELATVLRLDPAGVDLAASIGGLGLDSLMSVELKNRLERALGVSVPMARLLEGPTVLELAEELAGKMGVAAAAAAPAVDVVTAPAGVIEDGVLSIGQQALWFMHHLAPDSPAYNVVFATRLRSCVDVDRLERTLALVVERHPMLGTVFVAEAGKASQRPGGRLPKIERIDATGQDAATLSASVYAAAREPFDLGQAVLRARLFSVSADEHVLLLVVHHIVFDAWSFELLFRDLCTAYEALAAGRSPAWAPVPARYADFARWQRDLLAGEAGVAQRRYWEAELAGELPTLDVKAAKPRPVVRAFRGASVSFALPAELTRHVKALASREGMTPYMLIAAAYAQLLHQESGQEDILIGTPVAGRSRAEFTGVVGYFVNMLVLRLRVCGTAPGALLRQVRDKVLGALDHQDYPFALLIRSVRTTRDPARTPVFQAAFNFVRAQQVGDLSHFFIEGVPGESLRVGDLVMEPYPIPQQEGQFELELEVADTPGALCGRLKYDPDVYDRPTIERLVVDFERALERLAPSDSGEREELEL